MDASLKMNSKNDFESAKLHFFILEEVIDETRKFLRENLSNVDTDKVTLGLYAVHVKSKSLFLSKLHPKLKTIVETFCDRMPAYAWADRNSYDRLIYEKMFRCLLKLEESMCLLNAAAATLSLEPKKEDQDLDSHGDESAKSMLQ